MRRHSYGDAELVRSRTPYEFAIAIASFYVARDWIALNWATYLFDGDRWAVAIIDGASDIYNCSNLCRIIPRELNRDFIRLGIEDDDENDDMLAVDGVTDAVPSIAKRAKRIVIAINGRISRCQICGQASASAVKDDLRHVRYWDESADALRLEVMGHIRGIGVDWKKRGMCDRCGEMFRNKDWIHLAGRCRDWHRMPHRDFIMGKAEQARTMEATRPKSKNNPNDFFALASTARAIQETKTKMKNEKNR